MNELLSFLNGLDATVLYLVVGLLALGEAAAFVGLFVPGELAVLAGGAVAAQGRVSPWVMAGAAALGAVLGDAIGYEIGRRYGPRMLSSRLAARHERGIQAATAAFGRHGGAAVFVGRWTTVLRAFVPALAGALHLPYGTFLRYNLLGGVAWAATFTLLGYGAGASVHAVERVLGPGSWLLLGAVVLVAVLCGRSRTPQHDEEEARWPERVGR
jgi:undecaprenyl-diphosphatase